VPYYPISDDVMREIIKLQLSRIGRRLKENHGAEFGYDDNVVTEIANRCKEVESGARNVDHILTRTLLPEMSREFLGRMAAGESISRVHVSIGEASIGEASIGEASIGEASIGEAGSGEASLGQPSQFKYEIS